MSKVFTPLNVLEQLLKEAAVDPAARPEFYRAIIEQQLFIITEGEIPEHEQHIILNKEKPVQLRMIEIEGKPHIPIFTAVERISAVVPAKVGFLALKGCDLLKMLRGNYLMLNPGAAFGKAFTPGEIESLIDGSIFNPQERPDVGGKKILLGQPNEYPRHITEPLIRFFGRSRQVKTAYLAHAFIPDIDKKPHTLIGVEIAGDWEKVVFEAGVVVRDVAKDGEIVDFIQITPNSTDVINAYMQRETIPFYKRKKWLGLFDI